MTMVSSSRRPFNAVTYPRGIAAGRDDASATQKAVIPWMNPLAMSQSVQWWFKTVLKWVLTVLPGGEIQSKGEGFFFREGKTFGRSLRPAFNHLLLLHIQCNFSLWLAHLDPVIVGGPAHGEGVRSRVPVLSFNGLLLTVWPMRHHAPQWSLVDLLPR